MSEQPEQIHLERQVRPSGLVVIRIFGELDTYATQRIEPAFTAAVHDRVSQVLIDLSGVPYMTSRALAMFVVAAKALNSGGGTLRLACANEFMRDLFKRAGFAEVFPSFDSLDEAIQVMESGSPRGTGPLAPR